MAYIEIDNYQFSGIPYQGRILKGFGAVAIDYNAYGDGYTKPYIAACSSYDGHIEVNDIFIDLMIVDENNNILFDDFEPQYEVTPLSIRQFCKNCIENNVEEIIRAKAG